MTMLPMVTLTTGRRKRCLAAGAPARSPGRVGQAERVAPGDGDVVVG
jgi:hypothetical protein